MAQREFPIVDIEAYEAGTFATYMIWIWETLPGTADHSAVADFDNDGSTNLDEWLALTDPTSGNSFFAPGSNVVGANQVFTFPTV